MWVQVVQQGQQAIRAHPVLRVHAVQQEEPVLQEHLDLPVLVDLPDPEGILDPVATPVRADLREHLDLQGNQVMWDQLDLMVPPGKQVHQALQARKGLKDPLGNLVLQEPQVHLEALVILDHLGPVVPQGHKDQQGLLGQQVLKVRLVMSVCKDQLDNWGLLDQQVLQDSLAHLDHEETLDRLEAQDHRVRLDLQDHEAVRVSKDLKDPQDQLAKQGHQELLEIQDLREHQDRLVPLVLRDHLGQADNWDRLDKMAYLAQPDRRVRRAHLGNQVHLGQEEMLAR